MSRKTLWTLGKELEEYFQDLRDGDRSETTIQDYRWTPWNMFRGLEAAGMTVNPRKIGRKEIDHIRNVHYMGLSGGYVSGQIKCLLIFCRWAGNTELAKIHVAYGDTSPTNIRWLTDDQARVARAEAKGIEKMIIHCDLDLGMRRIEVLRLTTRSFKRGRMNLVEIHGKGRNGGKHRKINWHPDTEWILTEYLEGYRADVIAKARAKDPAVTVPDALLLCEAAGKLHAYHKTSVDELVSGVGDRLGFEVTNHDLRRTCGRMMYRANVRIEIISRMFGHADIRTTIKYLGLDFDDMSEAMQRYAEYQRVPALVVPQMGTNEFSQLDGGRAGIRSQESDWLEVINSRTRNIKRFRESLK